MVYYRKLNTVPHAIQEALAVYASYINQCASWPMMFRLCPHTKAHWFWWKNLRDQMLPEQGCTPAPLSVPFISLDPHIPQAHHVLSASIGLFLPLPQTPPPPPHRAKVHHIALNPNSPEDFSSHHLASLCEDTAQNLPWHLPGTLHTLSCMANFLSLNLVVHKGTQTTKTVRVSAF